MYGVVCIGDEIDEKPKRVALHPRILQQQETTHIPRTKGGGGVTRAQKLGLLGGK